MQTNHRKDKSDNRWIPTLLVLVLVLAIAGCASTRTESPASNNEKIGEKVISDAREDRLIMSEVTFKKGSAALTPASKTELSKALARAQTVGDVKEVKVLSWGDQEYPSKQDKRLADGQVDLAGERNSNLKRYLNVINGERRLDVDTYNMATRPNTFSEWIKTSDARLKDKLVSSGIPTTDEAGTGQRRASSALVLIQLNDKDRQNVNVTND